MAHEFRAAGGSAARVFNRSVRESGDKPRCGAKGGTQRERPHMPFARTVAAALTGHIEPSPVDGSRFCINPASGVVRKAASRLDWDPRR
jgi:hypothetical protein